jgi:hypothetical protein
MGDIRALIREILAEELASLRAKHACDAAVERVKVGTSAELTRFAVSILDRAADPGFESALRSGRLHFEPVRNIGTPEPLDRLPLTVERTPVVSQPETLVTTAPPTVPELRKKLITERDLAAIGSGETRLRVTKAARLTPLANDEARRRGIRIERTIA